MIRGTKLDFFEGSYMRHAMNRLKSGVCIKQYLLGIPSITDIISGKYGKLNRGEAELSH